MMQDVEAENETVEAGKHNCDVGSVAGISVVCFGGRGSRNTHFHHAEGTAHAHGSRAGNSK